MKITFLRNYRSKNGTVTFVYAVTGSQAQMEAYKEAQGDYFREDEETAKALYFTTRYVGETGKLVITSNNKVVADMSEFDKAASIVSQYGGNLGQSLADKAAEQLMGSKRAVETTEAKVEAPAVKEVAENATDL